MSQALYPDGTPIPDSELAKAEASRSVAFSSPDQQIKLVSKHGRPIDATAAQYAELAEQGARLETAAEAQARADKELYESPLEQAKTFGQGLVRGVPLVGGAALAGLTEAGIVDREAALKRQQYNPNLELAGELLSPLPGALLAKGAKALGTVDKAADAGRALGAASRVANAPVSAAAKLGTLAEAKGGALAARLGLGPAAQKAAGYATAGALDAGIYGVNNEIAQAALEDRLTELDGERLWSAFGHGAVIGGAASGALGALGEAGRKLLASQADNLAKTADDAVLRSSGLQRADVASLLEKKGEATVQRAARRLENDAAFKRVSTVDEQAALLLQRKREAGGALDTIRKDLETAGEARGIFSIKPDAQTIVQRIRTEVLNDGATGVAAEVQRGVNRSTNRKLEKTFLEPIESAIKEGREPNFSDIFAVRKELDDEAYLSKRGAKRFEPLKKARGILEDEYEKAVASAARNGDVPEETFARYKEAKAAYEDYITLHDKVQKRARNEAGKQPINFIDKVAFAGGAGSVLLNDGDISQGTITGLGIAGAGRLVSRYQNPVVALVARRLSQFAEHKAQTVEAIVGAKARRVVSPLTVDRDRDADRPEYADAVQEVLAVSSDPGEVVRRVVNSVGPIGQTDPRAYAGLVQSTMRANQYLRDTMPVPSSRATNSLTPQAEKPFVSRVEKQQYLDRVEAVRYPMGVFEDIAAGKVNFIKLQAVKATDPDLFEDIRKNVALELATKGDSLSFKRRTMLSLAFDLKADKSLLPEDMASIQASVNPPPVEPPEKRPGVSSSSTSKQDKTMILPYQEAG